MKQPQKTCPYGSEGGTENQLVVSNVLMDFLLNHMRLAHFFSTEAETLPLFVGVSQAHSPDECEQQEEACARYEQMMLDAD